jgi:hypothetical protein
MIIAESRLTLAVKPTTRALFCPSLSLQDTIACGTGCIHKTVFVANFFMTISFVS